MSKWMLVVGALLGASAVMMGAFGAHALKGILTGKTLEWYNTAVDYHSAHAFALLIAGVVAEINSRSNQRWINLAGIGFLCGTLIFSGSLYVMAFTKITLLGMVTPIGGALLIGGWLSLAVAAFRMSSPSQ